MKVLIIYHCGLSEEAKAYYREYVCQGIDLAVIIPTKIIIEGVESYTYSKRDDEKGYQFFPVDLRKPNSYGEGFKFFQLLRTIKRIKPDIIQVFNEYSGFQLTQSLLCRNILYGRKVPVVAYNAMNFPFKSPPFIFKFSIRFFKRIIRKLLYPFVFAFHKKYIDGVIACSTEALENVRALGVKIPMELAFWGIDFTTFYAKNRNLCREKLRIPKNIKLAGFFGRIVKEKGLDLLVKAISKLDGYYLMLPPKGDYKEELDKIIDSLGIRDRIYHYDYIPRETLVDYYNCLDVFVLASQLPPFWKEQYGRVLVEAMACGISVVGSKSGAIPEVLRGYPKHLIFEHYSPDDLAGKIKKVEELKFPKNFNLNNFLYKFSIKNFISQFIKFYKNLK